MFNPNSVIHQYQMNRLDTDNGICYSKQASHKSSRQYQTVHYHNGQSMKITFTKGHTIQILIQALLSSRTD